MVNQGSLLALREEKDKKVKELQRLKQELPRETLKTVRLEKEVRNLYSKLIQLCRQ